MTPMLPIIPITPIMRLVPAGPPIKLLANGAYVPYTLR